MIAGRAVERLVDALEEIAGALHRQALVAEKNLQLTQESVDIQRLLAADSLSLRAEYEEGKH